MNPVPTFMATWPSILTEIVSGLLFVLGALMAIYFAATWPMLTVLALATAGSLLYEWKLDANGFSWADVGQRQLGILAGIGLWLLVRILR